MRELLETNSKLTFSTRVFGLLYSLVDATDCLHSVQTFLQCGPSLS